MAEEQFQGNDHFQDSRSRSWFWCHNVILEMGLSVYEIAVYCALASHADGSKETRVCFPSYNRLSRLLGCSRPRMVQAVQILIQKGLLKKTARKDAQGHHSNLYELMEPIIRERNADEALSQPSPLVNQNNQGDRNLTPWSTPITTLVKQTNHPGKSGLPRRRISEQECVKKGVPPDPDPYSALYVQGDSDELEQA
jgi:predicted transcriptional regulator